jgi:hypothetical protein
VTDQIRATAAQPNQRPSVQIQFPAKPSISASEPAKD